MSQQQQTDSGNDALYVAGALMLLYILALVFLGEALTTAHLMVREGWLRAILFVWPSERLEEALFAVRAYHAKEWTSENLAMLNADLRVFMFLPLGGGLMWYTWRVWRIMPGTRFKRRFGRKTLCNSEAAIWPWILPALTLDLVNTPLDKGIWAMARRPLDFCRDFHLLEGKTINTDRTRRLFAAQLGALWEGPERLTGYRKALFACFLAQASRDKEGARDGLARMSESIAKGKIDTSFADALLKKHENSAVLKDVTGRHAYVTTVMCATLEAARRNGVLPPCYFTWLRPVNRSMWYALHGVGRKTAFCETAGIYAHFLAEKVLGKPLYQPYIEKAVTALELALRELQFDEETTDDVITEAFENLSPDERAMRNRAALE